MVARLIQRSVAMVALALAPAAAVVGLVRPGAQAAPAVTDPSLITPHFVPFATPERLVDSRPGQLGIIELPGGSLAGDLASKLSPGTPRRLVLGGQADIPLDAAAIAIDLVAVNPPAGGYISVYPCATAATPPPPTSTLNFATADIANSGFVTTTNGSVCVISNQTVDVVIDATGYFPAGSDFTPFPTPARLVDSRPGELGILEQSAGSIGKDLSSRLVANTPTRFVISGQAGIPLDPAAVAINVVAVSPAAAGYISVYPCAATTDPAPATSTLNYTTVDIANSALVSAVDGGICVVSNQSVHIVIDATGYFPGQSEFVPFAPPVRLLDSRPGQLGVLESGTGSIGHDVGVKLAPATPVRFIVEGQAGVPLGATALAINVVAVGPTAGGYVSVYPCAGVASPAPATSTINFVKADIANSALISMTAGGFCVVSNQSVDIILDATGYTD